MGPNKPMTLSVVGVGFAERYDPEASNQLKCEFNGTCIAAIRPRRVPLLYTPCIFIGVGSCEIGHFELVWAYRRCSRVLQSVSAQQARLIYTRLVCVAATTVPVRPRAEFRVPCLLTPLSGAHRNVYHAQTARARRRPSAPLPRRVPTTESSAHSLATLKVPLSRWPCTNTLAQRSRSSEAPAATKSNPCPCSWTPRQPPPRIHATHNPSALLPAPRTRTAALPRLFLFVTLCLQCAGMVHARTPFVYVLPPYARVCGDSRLPCHQVPPGFSLPHCCYHAFYYGVTGFNTHNESSADA